MISQEMILQVHGILHDTKKKTEHMYYFRKDKGRQGKGEYNNMLTC